MRCVLANLQAVLQRSRQPAYVIYVNPQLARLLEVPFSRKLPSPLAVRSMKRAFRRRNGVIPAHHLRSRSAARR
jgi:hypothetical protein